MASVALFCSLNVVTSCVLPPPAHGIALTLDATAIVAGSAIMMMSEEQSAEDSGPSAGGFGELVLITGVAAAAITLFIYAFDRPVAKESNKKQAEASGTWLRPVPAPERDGSDGSDGSEGPAAAADSYAARDAMLHPFTR